MTKTSGRNDLSRLPAELLNESEISQYTPQTFGICNKVINPRCSLAREETAWSSLPQGTIGFMVCRLWCGPSTLTMGDCQKGCVIR